jgi:hypothetical protein
VLSMVMGFRDYQREGAVAADPVAADVERLYRDRLPELRRVAALSACPLPVAGRQRRQGDKASTQSGMVAGEPDLRHGDSPRRQCGTQRTPLSWWGSSTFLRAVATLRYLLHAREMPRPLAPAS